MRRMAARQGSTGDGTDPPPPHGLSPSDSPSAAEVIAPNFWARVTSLPLVLTTCEMYAASKSRHALLGAGLGVVEKGVHLASTPAKAVANQLVEKVPAVSHIDSIACTCLDKIETTVTVLPPVKLPTVDVAQYMPKQEHYKRMTDMKEGASSALKSGMRRALLTYPGRQFIRGIDGMITMSEDALDNMNRRPEDCPSGPSESGDHTEDTSQLSQITELINKVGPNVNRQKVDGVVSPTLKAWIQLLKLFKRMLADMSGVSNKCPRESSSPIKADIQTRRRISPRKRASKGMIVSIRDYLLGILGVKNMSDLFSGMKIKLGHTDAELGDVNGHCDRKRKHDDIDEEDYSDSDDSETLDLVKALEDYCSDEDPDYNPDAEGASSDSLEYHEDTESDSDTPDKKSPTKKPDSTPSHKTHPPATNEAPSSDKKENLPMSPQQNHPLSPMVVLQPEWKRKSSLDEKPVPKPVQKPVVTPPAKPPSKPVEKNVEKTLIKPLEKPIDKIVQKSADKNLQRSPVTSVEKAADKSVEKPGGTITKLQEKTVETHLQKPVEKAVVTSAEKATTKPLEIPAVKPLEKNEEKTLQKTVQKPEGTSAEKSLAKLIEKPVLRSLENTAILSNANLVAKPMVKIAEKSEENQQKN